MKSNFVWLQLFDVVFFVELNGTLKLWVYDFVSNFVRFQLTRWVVFKCNFILNGFEFWDVTFNFFWFQFWGEIENFYIVPIMRWNSILYGLILRWFFSSVTLFYIFTNVSFFFFVTLWNPKVMKSIFVWFWFIFSLFLGVLCMQLKGSHQQI
jgi:hypothetical protein